MADDFSLTTLREAFHEPGCPLCNIERRVTGRYFQSLLGENAQNPLILRALESSLGYCPQHTLALVAFEQEILGAPSSTNFIYEQVIDAARKRITSRKPEPGLFRFLQRIWDHAARRFGWPLFHARLRLREGNCPVCTAIDEDVQTNTIALLEQIDREDPNFVLDYRISGGLCLRHLETALQSGSLDYPAACRWIIEDTIQRLAQNQQAMREYLRKSQRENRRERISAQEEAAWRKTLAWFSSLREEDFLHPAIPVKEILQEQKR